MTHAIYAKAFYLYSLQVGKVCGAIFKDIISVFQPARTVRI